MSYLVAFFAWLMEWCHSWCPNYWADIVIFTFITKVIQFPLSLWCQVNSLKMVSLMPQTNRIKMNHYGDSDTIGEKTAELFKKEHYHPLLSLVPLAIQILILMAFVKVIYGIGDKLTVPGAAKPLIACVPWTDGGVAWLMPLFAGAAAWLLGFTQNIFNPLQHEQTRTQQLVTNGISICISLFLGCFVASGVGLYWATSNLFSIVVQFCENLCIPPKKHVNYPELRRSQAELTKLESSLKANEKVVSKEDKKREKADYRRFFKVANKHLVFYSEGGGYYKYFSSVIEWLLAHSNVVIHYVTNDPADRVFQPSTFNLQPSEYAKRIRPYYIGQTKIIPLMMKMDADMVVMTTPDLNTYQVKRSYVRKDVEYAYVEHGPASIHLCYRKGAFDHFDTIFCTAPFHVAEHREVEKVYGLKPKKLVEAGYPFLDLLLGSDVPTAGDRSAPKRIMIANSHQADNVIDLCLPDFVKAMCQLSDSNHAQRYELVLRPHPQYVRRYPAKWQAVKERMAVQMLPENLRICFEDDFSQPSTMNLSDVLITDWSTIAYEYAFKTKRPTLFANTPMKVTNPEWKRISLVPTDITFRDQVGVTIEPKDIVEKASSVIQNMLDNPDKYASQIDALLAQMFNVGHAGAAVGKYIVETLISKKKQKKERK